MVLFLNSNVGFAVKCSTGSFTYMLLYVDLVFTKCLKSAGVTRTDDTNLLYRTMSGLQIFDDKMCSLSTPLYSDVFHRKNSSVQNCKYK